VRSNQAAWAAYTRLSWPGWRAKNVTRDTAMGGWQDCGEIEWLITSERVVGRLLASSEMISVWWSGLAGVDIDLESDRIVFNGVNGWTGTLTGPSVAPIAVAAIGMCHGVDALLVHPALTGFRLTDYWLPRPSSLPTSVGAGATILRMPSAG
jgi:hypothetical protein